MRQLFFFLVLSFSIKVSSCSCYSSGHPSSLKRINSATEVFEGKVLSQNYSENNQLYIYQLEVIKAYKGVKEKDMVEVVTMTTAASCRQFFPKNTTWLVYAFDGFTSRCSGNIILDTLSSEKINEKLSKFKRTQKEERFVEEFDKRNRLLAQGRQDVFGNAIGEWTYYSYNDDCTYTDKYNYDSNSCLTSKSSTKTCN